MAAEQACRRCRVVGRVQGVFFRASTARRARELGVVGHALNLDDGSVEVLAMGSTASVDALCAWLHTGPPGARVIRVEAAEEPLPARLPQDFSTG